MQVAGGGVARQAGQEPVLAEQRLEILGRLGDTSRGHAHVLDDQGHARRADRGQQSLHSLAHVPQHLDLVGGRA